MAEMTGSEALFGFAAWLTCRQEVTRMGAEHDAAVVADRVQEFCNANSLAEPADGWHRKLIHPTGG